MNRIRTIYLDGIEGLFYNIEDLLPIIGITQEEWNQIFYEPQNTLEKEYKKNGMMGFFKKMIDIFNKFHYIEKIQGSEGIQEHLYCHYLFFYFFLKKSDIEKIDKVIKSNNVESYFTK